MTNKTTLTDDAIHNLIVDFEIECDCGIETYPVDNIVPFARAIEQAVLKSPEIQSLKRMAETLDEKIETYERFGEICEFEGEPMIHAAHLEELRAAMEQQE